MPQARKLPRKSAAAGRPGNPRRRATSDEPPERQPGRPGRAPAPSTLRAGPPPDNPACDPQSGRCGDLASLRPWGSVRAASRPGGSALDDRHQQMDGERLMGSAARDEVESALAAFPGVAGVAVTEHDSRLADQNLVAYVAPDGPGLDMAELRAHARKILPASRTPVAIVLVDEIPVTAAGAVDIAALPAPEPDGLHPLPGAGHRPARDLVRSVRRGARRGPMRSGQRLLRPRRPLGRGDDAGRPCQRRLRRPDVDGRPVQGVHGCRYGPQTRPHG